MSPAAINHYQTLSTLRFASRAKIVKTKPIINEITEGNEELKIFKAQLNKLKEELLEKDDQLKQYAKKQLEIQRHLNKSNNMNAKLINEIQFIKQVRDKSEEDYATAQIDVASSKQYQDLLKELKFEQNNNLELFKELEIAKTKVKDYQKTQVDRQKQDLFETMIVNIEHILENLPNNQQVHPQQRGNWEDEVGSLLSDYQDDMKLLQEKYIQQLCVLYSRNLPKIDIIDDKFLQQNPKLDVYLNIISSNDNIDQDSQANNDENDSDDISYDIKTSAMRVIDDIEQKQIFDDIRIDFDSIIDNIAPEDNPSRLNQMLVSYYEEIHEVLQKRLDECQDIIGEYMTQLIESKKKNIQRHMEQLASGDHNHSESSFSTKGSKLDIESITIEHNRRLGQLRDQYEEFLQNAELEFFNVLKNIKGGSEMNYNEQDEINHVEKEHFDNIEEQKVMSNQYNYNINRSSNENIQGKISVTESDSAMSYQTYHPDQRTMLEQDQNYKIKPSKSTTSNPENYTYNPPPKVEPGMCFQKSSSISGK